MNEAQILTTDVLVIGSGLAGIRAAAKASEMGESVIVISRGDGASPHIYGFNAPIGSNDSPDLFINDTMRSGLGLNKFELVSGLGNRAEEAVYELEKAGVRFDRNKGKYNLLQPLGCSVPRYIRSGHNTGYKIHEAMKKILKKNEGKVIKNIFVLDLMEIENHICGAFCIDLNDGSEIAIKSKATVMCAGGSSNVYKFSTYPVDVKGDGYAMALRAGAKLVDMEFLQFEPCAAIFPESVKGLPVLTTLLNEGAYLENIDGKRFMENYEPVHMEKVQKDQLARCMVMEIERGKGTINGGLYFNCKNVCEDVVVNKHSMVYNPLKNAGIDLLKEPVEVAPGAHTHLGGVVIDRLCKTNVGGLFAAGEVTGGLHGANRLGGNSGAETIVFGKLAGQHAAEYTRQGTIISDRKVNKKVFEYWKKRQGQQSRKIDIENRMQLFDAKLNEMFYKSLGVVRNSENMAKALEQCDEIEYILEKSQIETSIEYVNYHAALNTITLGKMMLKAALMRNESRGCHFRSDYPNRDDIDWKRNVFIWQNGNEINTEIGNV